MDDERHKEEFEDVRVDCPWIFVSDSQKFICKANNAHCEQKNCAIFYFKNFFARRT